MPLTTIEGPRAETDMPNPGAQLAFSQDWKHRFIVYLTRILVIVVACVVSGCQLDVHHHVHLSDLNSSLDANTTGLQTVDEILEEWINGVD